MAPIRTTCFNQTACWICLFTSPLLKAILDQKSRGISTAAKVGFFLGLELSTNCRVVEVDFVRLGKPSNMRLMSRWRTDGGMPMTLAPCDTEDTATALSGLQISPPWL